VLLEGSFLLILPIRTLDRMISPFKQEEKRPISFASVEMQKAPRSYTKWVAAFILLLILAILFWIR